MTVRTALRFTKDRSCPICGGYDNTPRSSGVRCYGFLSDDGQYAHCTREECAHGLPQHPGSSTYAHRLNGECKCGTRHDPRPRMGEKTTTPGPKPRIVATYNYHDHEGKLLFQTVRYEPKDFRQRRPDGSGGWIWNLTGVTLVLYRLPELLKAPLDQWVYIVEGERDADRLATLGLVATCNPMGAGKWRPQYAAAFKGRKVVVIPDNDTPGEDHAKAIVASLMKVAAEIRRVGIG